MIVRRPRSLQRLAAGVLFVAIFVLQVLIPARGLVLRWHDGDADGTHRYSWHMYSLLDR